MSRELQESPFLGVPGGEVKTENPDGVTMSNEGDPKMSLNDGYGHPPIQSGDWQRWRSGLAPRGRP